MGDIHLDDVSFGDDDVDAAFRRWREAIERANSWTVTGRALLNPGPGGYGLFVPQQVGTISAVAASGGITAAPSANKLGQGNAVLRNQSGEDLTDGPTVKVWSNFTVAIPAGMRLEVAPNGSGDYKLIGANGCPPP